MVCRHYKTTRTATILIFRWFSLPSRLPPNLHSYKYNFIHQYYNLSDYFFTIYKATHSHCDNNWRPLIKGLYFLCINYSIFFLNSRQQTSHDLNPGPKAAMLTIELYSIDNKFESLNSVIVFFEKP